MVTTRSRRRAETLARSAVESRLAARAHAAGPNHGFQWIGSAVARVREWQVWCATTEARYDELAAHLAANHGEQLADVVRIAIDAAPPQYLLWLNAETVSTGPRTGE
ncbi:divalent cation tolerance protein CutA [Cryptosporangium minutisporangium]|uniref:divalent cation tolerance protein CutA n=1 Tax=Cryptosporangium minutisporangium TaxID=113569 RepID=UPI0031E696DB